MDPQAAAHLLGNVRAGVEPESVPVIAGCEAHGEDPDEVLLRDPAAVVGDGKRDHPAVASPELQKDLLAGPAGGLARVLDEVDQDLQQAVLVDLDLWQLLIALDDHELRGFSLSPLRDHEGLVKPVSKVGELAQAGLLGDPLLALDQLADVFDPVAERLDLVPYGGALLLQLLDEGAEERLDVLPARVRGEERREVLGVLGEDGCKPLQVVNAELIDPLADEGRRDVHAVQDVADVVEDAGGKLALAGRTSRLEQIPTGLLEADHHLVEAAPERPKLVVAGRVEARMEVLTSARLLGVLGQLQDGLEHEVVEDQDQAEEDDEAHRGDEDGARSHRRFSSLRDPPLGVRPDDDRGALQEVRNGGVRHDPARIDPGIQHGIGRACDLVEALTDVLRHGPWTADLPDVEELARVLADAVSNRVEDKAPSDDEAAVERVGR